MKKLLLPVLSVGVVLVGCQTQEEVVDTSETEVINVAISVSDTEDVFVEKEIEVESGTKLSEAMHENFELVEEGGFIESIEDVSQVPDENKWWVFEVNDEMVNESAEGFVLADGDEVDWELMSFE